VRGLFHVLAHVNWQSRNAMFATAHLLGAWHFIILLVKCGPPAAALMDLPVQEERIHYG
jgi:hypothetical protein